MKNNTLTNNIYWLNKASREFLADGYIGKDERAEDRIDQIGHTIQTLLDKTPRKNFNDTFDNIEKKFVEYMHKGFYSLSSPNWANIGKDTGLPISCYGSYVGDSIDQILEKQAEVGKMCKIGGGTSGYFGDIRARGSKISTGDFKSTGPVHFMELFDKAASVISQNGVRRGSFAAYLPAEHGDIEEFLQIRHPAHEIQDMSFGVCLSDSFMFSCLDGDKRSRRVMSKIIRKRYETGYPYLFFSDNANRAAPEVYKLLGRKILASNLCTEIMLSSTADESFVCNLASMNILHFDEWKDTDAVEVLVYYLDAVMTEFIEKTKNMQYMEAAHRFAKKQRALGLGVLGWHSYLQSKSIPFASFKAKMENFKIFSHIQKKALEANKILGAAYGSPEMLEGTGLRNVTMMAIAPTVSSSFILGQVSPSIEPYMSNIYIRDLAHSKFTCKNEFLEKILDTYGKNEIHVWKDIMNHGGSVQHLKFLSDHEKAVHATFSEIPQLEIIQQAAQRQPYIDQGQSLNVRIHKGVSPSVVNKLIFEAWRSGVKSLYYHRGVNPAQEVARDIMNCTSCES